MKKAISFVVVAFLASCSSTTAPVPPYASLAPVTTLSGQPVTTLSGQPLRGGWYPIQNRGEGGTPDTGGNDSAK